MSKRKGGFAFARPRVVNSYNGTLAEFEETGMTLLDYFAGQALAGIMAKNTRLYGRDKRGPSEIATDAYSIAAAMVTESQK